MADVKFSELTTLAAADVASGDILAVVDTSASTSKKLSIDNLSNLTPHQLRVVLDYSHPPVLVRIQALRSLASAPPP